MSERVILLLFLPHNPVAALYAYECDVPRETKEKGEVHKKFDYHEETYTLKNSGVGTATVVPLITPGPVTTRYTRRSVTAGPVGTTTIRTAKSPDEDADHHALAVETEKSEN